MSTFDTMCAWRNGELSNSEALQDCLINLAEWLPLSKEQESFKAMVEIVLTMREQEDEQPPIDLTT